MNSKARLAAMLVTGGVFAAGAVAVAVPAVAGAGPFGNPSSAASWAGQGAGSGMAGGGMGRHAQDGSCLPSTSAPAGVLNEQQKTALAAMAQEEKLAGDLYRAFAAQYPVAVFDRIAAAEDQHLTAVRTLLARYGISDPTEGKPAGQFADATVQATYDRLLAQGKGSQSAAIGVAQQVERTDIADLQQALNGLDAADVTQVYQHLLAASRQHLTAFSTWATR
ncbi:DUF2202 domain-containing protein [Dactylosporangium sp. NBC_01737]|uniref:DUF2202 domain-containing protein n=1 Tax=Dactylosporangium sp. NBC_01737 TaxID=2975959 RepID=UPI002E0FFBA5|nr:DUF2202 domain-containing protein [Dactylosporangium sp. NBC_01737]